jgi:hypothetical protein
VAFAFCDRGMRKKTAKAKKIKILNQFFFQIRAQFFFQKGKKYNGEIFCGRKVVSNKYER